MKPLQDEAYLLILKVIINKKLSQSILGVACTLFHYYTYYKSFRDFDRTQLAVTCVFLSSKLQNWFIPVEEAFVEYNNIKNAKFVNNTDKFDIVKQEIEILNLLGFEIDIETPYTFLEKYFDCNNFNNKQKNINIEKLAYNIINDTYRRPLCIYFPANILALSAIYIAYTICIDDKDSKDNFSVENLKLYDVNFKSEEVLDCASTVLKIFEDKIK